MESPEVLDVSKENIQPLRQGRNASQLSAALQAQSDTTILQNLLKKRQEYELLLRTYDGDDPLGIWFEYVEWVEQSFPKDGNEGNLMTLLQNCLTRFKDATEYFQDIRLVKLWIKYLEKLENPIEFYNQLHCHGIGSQCALFYRCWAYELYENGDFKQADKVLLSGIRRNAEPADELIRAHQNFQIAVARRFLDKSLAASEESAVEEERKVGNVLTTFGKKHKVPSVRIGGKVKSGGPGTLHSKENLMPQRNADPVNIYEAENDPGIARSVNKMQSVPYLETIKKENTKKPTPWSGVKQKSAYQYHPPKPSFQVLGDENAQPEPVSTVMFLNALKPIKKDDGFHCPIAVFEVPNPSQRPMYPKDQVYAGGTEYSIEELRAVKYMKRKETRNRDIQDAVKREITACTPSNRAELENTNHPTINLSDNSSAITSKKESNSIGCAENCVFQQLQQSSALGNNYVSDCPLEYKKLPEQQSQPNSQNQHIVDGPKYTNSNESYQAEMNNLSAFGSRVALQQVPQQVVDGNCVPENVNHTDVSTSLNKEDMQCSENTNRILSSKKPNSCMSVLSVAENEKQNLNIQGEFPVKGSGFSVFTTEGIDSRETVSAGDFFTSLNKEEIPHSESAGIILSSSKPSSCVPVLLAAKNEKQNLNDHGAFPVKGSGFSVFTTGGGINSQKTVKADGFPVSFSKEEIPRSENAGIMLLSNKTRSFVPDLAAENVQQKLNKQGAFPVKGSGFSVFTTEDIDSQETVKAGDFFTSLNKEDVPHSKNAGIILSSSKPSSCMPVHLAAKNEKQNLNDHGALPEKGSGFSVFTTEGIDSQETVKAGDFFTSLNKEEIPHSENENTDFMLLSNKPHSWTNSLLVVENDQQKLHNQDMFPVKGSDFTVSTKRCGTGAAETVKVGDNSTYSRGEEGVSHSDLTNKLLLPNKVEGLSSPVLIQGNENKEYAEIQEGTTSVNGNCNRQFPIFNDGDNCHTTGQVGFVKTEEEHGFSDFPNKNKNLFSHSVLCGPNKQLFEDVRSFSSTTKKNKVAPFPLFIDNEVPAENEPCASKRELFKNVAREPSGADSKENMALLSTYMPTNRPAALKREVKLCENEVMASMIKLIRKKASEQMQEPDPQESEKVTPATVVPKKPEGCAITSMSANSEEVLQVINECWASPPKSKKDSGNELSPELHEQPEDIDFQHSPLLKMSAVLTGGTGVFLENKENALPQSTKRKENSDLPNSPTLCFGSHMVAEPRALDDTCCSMMFSKTLISSTPNRKSGGPLSSDSSDTSPPDSQEFKIPRRYTPLQAEGFGIVPQRGLLSVIMESSKENKSQSSSGSSSGGRATHHTALSLVSPQTENTHSVLEMQPTYEAHVLKSGSLSPHDEGSSSSI